MSKYIDADLLRKEIERNTPFHHRVYLKIPLALIDYLQQEQPIQVNFLTWRDINDLERIINNVHYEFRNGIGEKSFGEEVLERFRAERDDHEQPGVDLAKEIEKYYYDNFAFISSAHTPTKDIVSDIATHFYERGQKNAANKFDEIEYNRQRAEGEILDKTLDEAAEEYEIEHTYQRYDGGGLTPEYNATLAEAFKAGAKWMAGQGVTKEAVIGMATKDIEINVSQRTLDALGLGPGDKVIVQIRKKEEAK